MSNNESPYAQVNWAPAPLDKNCWRVLRFLHRHYGWAEKHSMEMKFDERYQQTIDYLISTKYLEEITTESGKGPQAIIVGKILTIQTHPRLGLHGYANTYIRLTPMANKAMEDRPHMIFDHWLTKTIAIWGAITGTLALLIDLLPYFSKG